MIKKIPKFKTVEEAALFWQHHEILDYYDPGEFKIVDPQKNRKLRFLDPRKKQKKELVSLRIDSNILKLAKDRAAQKKVGYQSILRNWLEKSAARRVP